MYQVYSNFMVAWEMFCNEKKKRMGRSDGSEGIRLWRLGLGACLINQI